MEAKFESNGLWSGELSTRADWSAGIENRYWIGALGQGSQYRIRPEYQLGSTADISPMKL